ncbi:ATP-binding protein [Saccharibacillus sp. JS10]|uniref:ATP-binding protein n=1 Tax=Saccharibacillus sp. JS10 TaxID=2950552 RepID=UPI00210B9C2D|nr:ATP-binding protein [Saccharibacillus sp. JS10]MCQ4087440.1 histidine kinase [Saccharibacillus sp. JS10]
MKKWNWLIALLVYILVVAQYLYVAAATPPVQVKVQPGENGQVIVESVASGYWGDGRLQVGDRIVEVDGKDPEQHYTVRHYGWLERVHEITVIKPGMETQTLQVQRLPIGEALSPLFAPLAAAILFLIFAILLRIYAYRDPSSFWLAVFFLFTGAAYLGGYTVNRLEPIGTLLFEFVFLMVPIAFIHFMNRYLGRFGERLANKSWMIFFYVCMVFHVGVTAIRELVDRNLLTWESPLFTVFFALPNIFAVLRLIQKYRKHRSDDLNSLFKLTLIAHTLAFSPFIFLYSIPRLFGFPLISVGAATAFLLTLPVIYLYMLLTRRIFDVGFVLNRFLYYAAIAIVPSAIMALLGAWMVRSEHFDQVGMVRLFLVFYLIIVVLLFVKEFLDRNLRKTGKNRLSSVGSFERFSHHVSRVMKREDLERALEQEIESTIKVSALAFTNWEPSMDEVDIDVLEKQERHRLAQVLREKAEQLVPGVVLSLPRGICLVIGNKDSQVYLLWLDDKANHTRYNPDERNWLSTLANYSAIVFENLYLIQGLIGNLEEEMNKQGDTPSWVLRLIFNLSENERRRLASDLHDSALQDQIIWLRRLETAILDYEMPQALNTELERIKEGLLDVIHQIRETCNELRPPLLMEMGLIQAMEQLFMEAQMRTDYTVEFEAAGSTEVLDDEQTLAIYRITQELLRNASKHAEASRVYIYLATNGEQFIYQYRDNGVGMNEEDAADSFSHMGLAGIKERVRSFEGTFTWRSKPGAGMQAEIMLPLRGKI